MPAPKGHPRYGGRAKGTPNKRTETLIEICERKGINLFEALLDLTLHPDPSIKIQAVKEACSYIYQKRGVQLNISGDLELRAAERLKEVQALPIQEKMLRIEAAKKKLEKK